MLTRLNDRPFVDAFSTVPRSIAPVAPVAGAVGVALSVVLLPHEPRIASTPAIALVVAAGFAAALSFRIAIDGRPIGRVDLDLRATGWLVVLATLVLWPLATAAGTNVSPARTVAVVTVLALGFFTASRAAWRMRPTIERRLDDADPRRADDIRPPLPPVCAAFKRVTDVVLGLVALTLCAPAIAMAAVAIILDTRGGWRFVQTRIGKDGRPFRMYKLRTMHVDNDDTEHRAYVAGLIRGESGAFNGRFKLTDDPRLTRVGRLLRTLSLDEIPQFLNVVKGDMSIVGPRPPLPTEVELYDADAWARLRLKPGLTGLWQVSGRSRLNFSQMVDLDVKYGQQWTPLLDLRIMLRTPKVMLWSRDTA